MSVHIGLYYPFIHFKDDRWLKLAALYWDKMARIVPRGYEHVEGGDSEVARRLSDELDFIKNMQPHLTWKLEDDLGIVLATRADKLRQRYGLEHIDKWPIDPVTARSCSRARDNRLAYVFVEKIHPTVEQKLCELNLATERVEDRWIGMHPRLAQVYMYALAEATAEEALHPVTDEVFDHVVLSGDSVETMSRALLYDDRNKRPASDDLPAIPGPAEVTQTLASIAIENAIPRDLGDVDVAKIIRLRKQYRDELTAFQRWMHELGPMLWEQLSEVRSAELANVCLQAFYDKEIKPHIAALRGAITSVGLKAAGGALSIKLEVPDLIGKLLIGLGFVLNPLCGAACAVGLQLIPVVREAQGQAHEIAKQQPAAFLLHVEEGLRPVTQLQWIRDRVRQFALGE